MKLSNIIKTYLASGCLLTTTGFLFYYGLSRDIAWPPVVGFGLPALLAGLRYSKRLWQLAGPAQSGRNYILQQGNGRAVPITAHGKTQWLNLQSVVPFLHFNPSLQSSAIGWQREPTTWQWCVVPTCYGRKPLIITEPYVAKMAQWIYDRQQDDATKADAASRPAWCRDVDASQGSYWAALGLLMAGGAVREWGRSKIITCTPNRAINRIKLTCPTDTIINV